MQQQQGSDEAVYNDMCAFLSLTINQNRAWRLYSNAAVKGLLQAEKFIQITQKLVPNLHPEEIRVLIQFLFRGNNVQIDHLADEFKISDQQRKDSQQVQSKKLNSNTLDQNQNLQKPQNPQNSQNLSKNPPQIISNPSNLQQIPKVKSEVREEIEKLFNSVDSNKNGWLDQKEMHDALIKIGINSSPIDLTEYFKTFDKNNDQKISLEEFEIVLKDMLMKELINGDNLIDDIRNEFRFLCNPNLMELDLTQVRQILLKCGVKISIEDVVEVFQEIDADKSGQVDLDEFIQFMQKPLSQINKNSQDIFMRIIASRELTLTDLKDMFLSLPSHFVISFLRQANKKLNNLPSCIFRPKLNPTGLLYDDLPLIKAQKYNLKQPLIDKQNYHPLVQLEIRIIKCEGVPIPDDTLVKWDQFILREAAVCIFDKTRRQFQGNIIYVPVQWDQNKPDIWNIAPLYPLILTINDFDPKQDSQLELIIELIAYLDKNDQACGLSVCFGTIHFSQFKAGEKLNIILQGGSPFNILNIDPNDIRQGQGFFRNFSKKTKPVMELQFVKIDDKKVMSDLAVMPKREFLAFNSIKGGELDQQLSSNVKIKSFLNALDVPNIGDGLAIWWNETIEKKQLLHENKLEIFSTLCDHISLMFSRKDFKFKKRYPTQKVEQFKPLFDKRQLCLQELLIDVAVQAGLGQAGVRSKTYFDMEPMNLTELMDEDENDQSFNQVLKRKLIKK